MLYREIIVFFLRSVENVQFVMVGLVVHKVATGLSANHLNLLNGVIRNSGRKPSTLAGFVHVKSPQNVTPVVILSAHV